MRIRHVSVLLSVLALGSLPIPAQASDPVPEIGEVVLHAANGTGCPQGTAHVVPGEPMNLAVRYDSFQVQTAPATARRRFCQLTVSVTVPEGYTYSVAGSRHRGVAAVADGMTASVRSTYYYQGEFSQLVRSGAVVGSPWEISDPFVDDGQPVSWWRPCGSQVYLNIKMELSLNTNNLPIPSQVNLNGPDAGSDFAFTMRPC